MALKFTELSDEMYLVNSDGELCTAKEQEKEAALTKTNLTCSSCAAIYGFIQQLLVNLDVTTSCCLGNSSTCNDTIANERTNPAKGSHALLSSIQQC